MLRIRFAAIGRPFFTSSKKARGTGAGRKVKATEVRVTFWFVDVRESLKGLLFRRLFKLKPDNFIKNGSFKTV